MSIRDRNCDACNYRENDRLEHFSEYDKIYECPKCGALTFRALVGISLMDTSGCTAYARWEDNENDKASNGLGHTMLQF